MAPTIRSTVKSVLAIRVYFRLPGGKTREMVETFGMKRMNGIVSWTSTAGSTFEVSKRPDCSVFALMKVPNARAVQGNRHQVRRLGWSPGFNLVIWGRFIVDVLCK